jgi:hypothetical protein
MWGENGQGQYADINIEDAVVPTRMGVANNWQSLILGNNATYAIKQTEHLELGWWNKSRRR